MCKKKDRRTPSIGLRSSQRFLEASLRGMRALPWSETDHAYMKRMVGSTPNTGTSMTQKMPRLVDHSSLKGVPNANLETSKAEQHMHPRC